MSKEKSKFSKSNLNKSSLSDVEKTLDSFSKLELSLNENIDLFDSLQRFNSVVDDNFKERLEGLTKSLSSIGPTNHMKSISGLAERLNTFSGLDYNDYKNSMENVHFDSYNDYLSSLSNVIQLSLSDRIVNNVYEGFDIVSQVLEGIHLNGYISKYNKRGIEIQEISSHEDFCNLINLFREEDNEKRFYRGESNSNWDHIPSLLRDPEIVCDAGEEFDVSDLIDKYNEKNVKMFSNEGTYEIFARFQHAGKKTMFMDYSKDPFVALSFAASRDNDSETFEDIAVYVLELRDSDDIVHEIGMASKIVNNFKICKISMSNFDRVTFEEDIHIIDIANNDRMKCQKGVFLVFEKEYVVDKEIEMNDLELFDMLVKKRTKSMIEKFDIVKYVIKSDFVNEINEIIEYEFPHCRYEYLMDPNKFLNGEDG